ncbi:MAG: DUF4097 family beta strand repeat-containing protein [Butyricicoccus sp.]
MKTLVKLLIAAALLGVILLAVGVWNGGQLYTGYENGALRPFFGLRGTYDSGAVENGTGEVNDPESIDVLRIEVAAGSCEIEMGDRLRWSGDVDADINGGTLTLTTRAGESEIVLPERKFDELTVAISGGALDAERLNAGAGVIEITGGAADIDQFYADSARIEGSMGAVEIDSLYARSADLHISAGELCADALYVDQITAKCTGGQMSLGLPRDPTSYRCTADVTAGAALWNGSSLSSAGFGGADTAYTLDLKVTAGQLNLYSHS